MTARKIDGKAMAQEVRNEVKTEVDSFLARYPDTKVKLVAVMVGFDQASHAYVRNKERACREVGIDTAVWQVSRTENLSNVLKMIDLFNRDDKVHGILVQLPLPSGMDKDCIFDAIDPRKDVDVFTAVNTGLLVQNRPYLLPCTPQAVREILVRSGVTIKGAKIGIVNRSLIVGQPLATMLVQDDVLANATVTVCHEHTRNIGDVLRGCDIIVTAVGKPDVYHLRADWVRPGATVIDVAINRRENGTLYGDCEPDVWEVAGAVTPVPGGVGPLTCAMLLRNTLRAAEYQIQGRN